MNLRQLKSWYETNIRSVRRPTLEAQWKFGQHVADYIGGIKTPDAALAKQLGFTDSSSARQAVKFVTWCTRTEVRKLQANQVPWRAIVKALGRPQDQKLKQRLLAGKLRRLREVDSYLEKDEKRLTRSKLPSGLAERLTNVRERVQRIKDPVEQIITAADEGGPEAGWSRTEVAKQAHKLRAILSDTQIKLVRADQAIRRALRDSKPK